MSNVIDPPDSPTEPVVKATIIPYKKNGVVICTTSLKEATNATAEAKRQMPIGTYVSITQLVDGLIARMILLLDILKNRTLMFFQMKNGVVVLTIEIYQSTLLNIKIMAYLNAVNVDIMLTKRHIITI